MIVDPQDLHRRDIYKLMISCVVPRPIAWVSSVSRDGIDNLAPFSFFNVATTDPPTLVISVGRRRGVQKDTARNVLEMKEAVVHIPTRSLAERMVQTSAEVEPEIDEFELAQLERLPSDKVGPHRLKEAAIAMECVLSHHLEMGRSRNDLLFLEVVRVHLDESFLDAQGRPDPSRLRAVGRLGGTGYCDTEQVFQIERP